MRKFDPQCRACPRLARHLDGIRRRYPSYHAGPVAPFGPRRTRFLVVGLAPGMHGANRTGRPFTGDFAGRFLYETLHRYGFSSRAVSVAFDDGLRLRNCRITNAVKCLPPGNKPESSEVRRCNEFLASELRELGRGGVILSLGVIAHEAVLKALGFRRSHFPFRHGAQHRLPNGFMLLNSYHCSRYNTQTRRLTPAMFDSVIGRARAILDKSRNVIRGS